MKIAVPMAQGCLCMHFGHCEAFGIFDVENNQIVKSEVMTPPPHEPGLYPRLLSEKGVNLVITGGMGMNARNLFAANGVQVVTGAMGSDLAEIVKAYINGTLTTGANTCDH